MRKLCVCLLVMCCVPVLASAQVFVARLTGANEFPGPGDPNGTGLAVVRIEGTTVHFTLYVKDISSVITGAHIHNAPAGQSAGVFVGFSPLVFTDGVATGSVQNVPPDRISAIIANPAGHYVNIHTNEFGGGAIRGQLEAGCTPSQSLCVEQNRFRVEANWMVPDGSFGAGRGIKLTDDSGYFWFFNEDNVELLVKVLNACSVFNSQWVFAAGLTNVNVDLFVVDTQTGASRRYRNPQGTAFAPVQDTAAFICP